MSSTDRIKNDAVAIWKAGVAAVDGRKLVRENVAWSKDELRLGTEMFPIPEIDRLIVVGFGKASGAMAAGFEEALADRLFDTFQVSGWVNVPEDQVVQTQAITVNGCRPSGENLPTQKVLDGTVRVLDLVRNAGPNDIVVCLISGGGSALLEKPVEPITLDEFRATTTFLSQSGATIYELNAVRRLISEVKGGQLAIESGGAPMVSLIISDVVGDDVSVIASGPTAIPAQQPAAINVLKKFAIQRGSIPESVWKIVESFDVETLPTSFPYSLEITNTIIGNAETGMRAAAEKAMGLGYQVETAQPNGNEGEVADVAKQVAGQIMGSNRSSDSSMKPHCHIMAGETTLQVCDSPGMGGRNQHLVLSTLNELLSKSTGQECLEQTMFCVLSGGTDGEDGNTSAAGAWFDSDWFSKKLQSSSNGSIECLREKVKASLDAFDSNRFLTEHGLLFEATHTATNVGDLRIVLWRNGD